VLAIRIYTKNNTHLAVAVLNSQAKWVFIPIFNAFFI